MTTMLATRAARRRAVAFSVLLAASLVLMAVSSSPGVTEFQNAMSFALRPVTGAVHGLADTITSTLGAFGEIQQLHSDNAALRRDMERLTIENERAQAIEAENAQLTALLQLRSSLTFETTAAEVISRDSGETRRVVTLSKGTDAGIEVGDVVIAEGGALVGRVTQVGPNAAAVTLVSDGSSTVSGQTEQSHARGDVVGQLGGALIMQNIDSTIPVKPGEQVLTAGIELAGGIRSPYPKNLLIGVITDVRKDPNSVVQTAYLQPSTDIAQLQVALVILVYSGGLPGSDDTPMACGLTGPGGALPGGEQPCIAPSAPAASPIVP
jgi:rod shape-determining protein MreC